jgi:hypothetical protein
VERLFNSARDICHYRRGSLNAATIQDLMMFMCTSRFEIEEKQLAFVNNYLSNEETQVDDEERDAQFLEHVQDPISEDEGDDPVPEQGQLLIEAASQCVLGKRRKSVASESEIEEAQESAPETDDEDNLPLPTISMISTGGTTTQMRTSRRVRKRSRRDDEYDYY